jgi:uncharacterized SAM-binding protein YcdF (DUF218 family)
VFFFLSKLLDVFLSPYTWGLLLLAAAVPWRARAARRWRRRRACGAAGLALLVVISLHPVANALAWSVEHTSTSTYRPDVTYDAVVLLGGMVDEEVGAATNLPSLNDNVERLLVTYQLLHDDRARVVIITSGTVDKKLAAYSETAVLARQLEGWGIARERIILEDRALNTRDNAVYSQQIARERGLERVVIVTSAFHMPRAADCFAAVGMKVDTLAVDYRAHPNAVGQLADWLPRARELASTSGFVRELFGRLVYRVQGYSKPAR